MRTRWVATGQGLISRAKSGCLHLARVPNCPCGKFRTAKSSARSHDRRPPTRQECRPTSRALALASVHWVASVARDYGSRGKVRSPPFAMFCWHPDRRLLRAETYLPAVAKERRESAYLRPHNRPNPECPLYVDSGRPVCATGRYSPTAWLMGQIGPKRRLRFARAFDCVRCEASRRKACMRGLLAVHAGSQRRFQRLRVGQGLRRLPARLRERADQAPDGGREREPGRRLGRAAIRVVAEGQLLSSKPVRRRQAQ